MHRTLFERLIPALAPRAGRMSVLAQSVQRNLQHLFGSQQGGSAASPEYGLPDLRYLSERLRNDRAGIEALLASLIERFEPRLRRVSVEFLDPRDRRKDPRLPLPQEENLFFACFRIQGELVEQSFEGPIVHGRIQFETQQNQEGLFLIEKTFTT